MKALTILLFAAFVVIAILHAGFGLLSVATVQWSCGLLILAWIAVYVGNLVRSARK